MALLGPPPTVIFNTKLHNRHRLPCLPCPPSHLRKDQPNVLKTRTSITTTHNHRQALGTLNMASETDGEERILLWEERPREVLWRRKWTGLDILVTGMVAALHLLCVFAPFTFTWGALWVAIGLYLMTGLLGISLSYHRHLSHKSFKIPKWLEYIFAYCGVHAIQGSPSDWVRTHWYHHQYCDSERDPHTPVKGLWFSYIHWIFNTDKIKRMSGEPNIMEDMEKQVFYRFLRKTYFLHHMALALLLYAIGGFPFLVWGMGVRTICLYHMTWLVNAIGHGLGPQTWITNDLSRNIWWLGTLTYGEGWHNNHHAFQYSAQFGLNKWQLDMTWYVIRLLEIVGLATDVKRPTPTDIQRKAVASKT